MLKKLVEWLTAMTTTINKTIHKTSEITSTQLLAGLDSLRYSSILDGPIRLRIKESNYSKNACIIYSESSKNMHKSW